MAGIGQGVASAPDGRVLTLTYPGGQQRIEADPGARIVGIIPGDRSLLKPGPPCWCWRPAPTTAR